MAYETYWLNKYGQLVWWPCDKQGERITDQAALSQILAKNNRRLGNLYGKEPSSAVAHFDQ